MDLNNCSKREWIYDGLCFITPFKLLRKTPNVEFYTIPEVIEGLSSVDKVIHQSGAKSPMIEGSNKHFWYMHPHQEDNLIVYSGKRIVELYSLDHKKVEKFEVEHDKIVHNGKVIFCGEGILGFPTRVFHRVSSPNGSVSTNYAKRSEGFDIKTNFNIYDLNTQTGKFTIARDGFKDQ